MAQRRNGGKMMITWHIRY